ncbi:MAG: type III secretion system stator protein SctL [Allorhizobium sp.]
MGPYYRLSELGFKLPAGAHVIKRSAFEAIEASEALVLDAERQAASLVAGAEAAFEAEKQRGFQEGMAMARIEAAARLVNESLMLDERLAAIEGGLADLVVAAMRRLMEDFDDRSKAQMLVRTALRRMRREKRAELRVSPAQFSEMKMAIDGIVREFPEIDFVDVVEDETLAAPNVVIETAVGRVDGDMGRTIEALETAIRATVRGISGAGYERNAAE